MLEALLSGYQPRTDAEAVDVDRARGLLTNGDPWDRSTSLHLTGSALVVHPETRRVLLRWHARQRAWLQVGGHADPGETDPLTIALREGNEETGLSDLAPWPDTALRQVVVVPVPEAPHEPAHEHVDLRFLLSTEQPDKIQPENSDAELRWLSIPEALELTTEENLRELLRRADRLLD